MRRRFLHAYLKAFSKNRSIKSFHPSPSFILSFSEKFPLTLSQHDPTKAGLVGKLFSLSHSQIPKFPIHAQRTKRQGRTRSLIKLTPRLASCPGTATHAPPRRRSRDCQQPGGSRPSEERREMTPPNQSDPLRNGC